MMTDTAVEHEAITIKSTEVVQQAAKMAVEVQNACNGRAILGALLNHRDVMQSESRMDTDVANQHPVTIAVLDKLASLARTQTFSVGFGADRILAAHSACERLAAGESVEWEICP
jgi:hypothetical protein